MGPDSGRNRILHLCKIIQLIYHGDIDSGRAGSTVAAVGTLSGISMAGGMGQNCGIILFLLESIVKVVERSMLVNGLQCKKINFRGITDATLFREQRKVAITIGIGCSAFHSIYEWVSINDMEKTVRTLVSISKERI